METKTQLMDMKIGCEYESGFIRKLIGHVELFQYHTHPVVSVLMKGFSKVITRRVFPPAAAGAAKGGEFNEHA